jgi:hypothetical protein
MESFKEKLIFDSFSCDLNIDDDLLKNLDKFILKNPGISFEDCVSKFSNHLNVDQLKFLINQVNRNINTYYGIIGPFKVEDNKIFKKLNLKNPDDRSRLYHLISENSELNKQNEDLKKKIVILMEEFETMKKLTKEKPKQNVYHIMWNQNKEDDWCEIDEYTQTNTIVIANNEKEARDLAEKKVSGPCDNFWNNKKYTNCTLAPLTESRIIHAGP